MDGNQRLKIVGVALVSVGLVWLFLAYEPVDRERRLAVREETSRPRIACPVLTVYDGDTLACDFNGNGKVDPPREQVRFLGIDTPEMNYSRKNRLGGKENEPYAEAASRWLTRQAQGKTLYLETDVRETDSYGRTLAHAFRKRDSRVSLGEELLKLGYAGVLFIEPNQRYKQRFLKAEHQARMQGRGLWAEWVEEVSD